MRKITIIIALLMTTLFAQISLEDLIDASLGTNPRIESRKNLLLSAKARRFSVYSGLLPKADVNFRYTYLGEVPYLAFPDELSSMMPEMGRIEMGKHDNYDLTLTVQQPIFTGLSLYRGIKLSNIDVESNDIQLNKTKSETVLEVKKGYYNLIRAISSLATAKAAKDGILAHHEDLQNLFENGMVAKNDLLRAKVALSEMDLNIVRIEHGIELARENLSVLTYIPAENIIIDTTLYFEKTRMNRAVAESLALIHNFDIRSLDIGLRASQQKLGLAYAKFMPNIALAGNYHYKNPNQDLEENWEDSWDVSLVAQLNIFTFGHDIAEAAAAEYDKKSYEKNKEYAERMIRQGVNAVILSIEEAEISIEITEAEIEQAEENLRITRDRFLAGDATNTVVLDAEAALYRARNNRINAICDHNIKKAELYSMIGYVR